MIASALGSYPRIGNGAEKQRLRRSIQKFQAGELSRDELRRVEDDVVREVLDEQASSGLDWITDGLVRWEDGQTYFADRLEGFRRGQLIRYFDTNTYYRQPVAVGPVRWKGPITVSDWEFARAHAPREPRPVVTGPYTLARLSEDRHYGDFDTFAGDVAAALQQEVAALAKAGATRIQIDEPALLASPSDEPLARRLFERVAAGATGAEVRPGARSGIAGGAARQDRRVARRGCVPRCRHRSAHARSAGAGRRRRWQVGGCRDRERAQHAPRDRRRDSRRALSCKRSPAGGEARGHAFGRTRVPAAGSRAGQAGASERGCSRLLGGGAEMNDGVLLTSTIGSFPKPEYLTKARASVQKGTLGEPELRALEERATRETVALQEELGLDVLVDGEMYRGDMATYFAERMDGFAISGLVRSYGNRYYRKPIITGPIGRPRGDQASTGGAGRSR